MRARSGHRPPASGSTPTCAPAAEAVVGILNGVDYSVWNPATDPFLPHNYDHDDLSGKSLNKIALTDLLRLGGAAGSPLIGMVTRLTSQKGIDLVMQVLPALIETRELRFVVLGNGETRYERFFEDLQRRFPAARCFMKVTARSSLTSSRAQRTSS